MLSRASKTAHEARCDRCLAPLIGLPADENEARAAVVTAGWRFYRYSPTSPEQTICPTCPDVPPMPKRRARK